MPVPQSAEFDPPWSAWRPEEVAERLHGVTTPWWVVAGWSVDLFLGRQTREHDDLEIAVPAGGFSEIRAALAPFEFDVPLPDRCVPLNEDALGTSHQTWLRDPISGCYLVDVFRDPHDGDTWICRRDETLRRPIAGIVRRTPAGIPYLTPEITLLFKARWHRPKDEADFEKVVARLTAEQRGWLRAALGRVHPDHAWTARV